MRQIGLSAKGRACGEYQHSAKLTFSKVAEVRRLIAEKNTKTSIARMFGVSRSSISAIANGKTWVSPIARMANHIDAADLVQMHQGEGLQLTAEKAQATKWSVRRAMDKAGIAWDGVRRRPRPSHCKRGHPLSGKNLVTRPDGRRNCRACMKAANEEYRAEQRQKTKQANA